jgi:hypothetical protein
VRAAFLLLSCTCIGCYDVAPIETSELEGEGGGAATTPVFTSATSGGGKGAGKGAVSSASTQAVAASASVASSASTGAFDFVLYASCRTDLQYKGACSHDGAMAIFWRGNDPTRLLCQPHDPITDAPYCALNFCPLACEERVCVHGDIENAACFEQQAMVVSCRDDAVGDTCINGVAIARDPEDDDNCYIRDCRAEGLDCQPGTPPRCT